MSHIVYVGSVEYVSVTVTADVTLDTQPVAISLDHGTTWLTAGWQGSAGTTRSARTASPVTFTERDNLPVHVRVTDTPEIPIIRAGTLNVTNP